MTNAWANLHNQRTTASLTEDEYRTAASIIIGQIQAAIEDEGGNVDYKLVPSTLVATLRNHATDQTVLDWINETCRELGVSSNRVAGV
jgi:hypothetical protein